MKTNRAYRMVNKQEWIQTLYKNDTVISLFPVQRYYMNVSQTNTNKKNDR